MRIKELGFVPSSSVGLACDGMHWAQMQSICEAICNKRAISPFFLHCVKNPHFIQTRYPANSEEMVDVRNYPQQPSSKSGLNELSRRRMFARERFELVDFLHYLAAFAPSACAMETCCART
jgi:hypothetical protein